MTQLTAESMPALGIATPTYNRSAVKVGVVHLGVGGFHRAHQAMYLDRLMNEGRAMEWGICGVGVLPSDRHMAEVMAAQDCLYTLVVKDADGTWEPRVIGSIVEYLMAPDDPEAVIEKMAAPTTRIVSLTITEGGYAFNQVTGDFEADSPDVVHDLADPSTPRTSFALVTEALVRRRERGVAPFTVMSCDNIQGNGEVARRSFTAFARLRDPELGDWMAAEVSFPNSMVDRITPQTTEDDRAEILTRFDVTDAWPVVCEPFTQWVLEDSFGATPDTGPARPPLEDVGVQVVSDVEPYELMKLRLLNASHQGLCYFAHLAGYRLVHEAAQDPLFAAFLLSYMDREATPTLSAVPGIDLDDYKHTLIARFSNGEVRDTIARLCAESSDRIPKWLLPVVRSQLASGGEITRSVAIVASWARYAEGTDEQGQPITVVDRLADRLKAAAARQAQEPLAFVSDRELFGDLVDDERFVAAFTETLDNLHSIGARATLEAIAAR